MTRGQALLLGYLAGTELVQEKPLSREVIRAQLALIPEEYWDYWLKAYKWALEQRGIYSVE